MTKSLLFSFTIVLSFSSIAQFDSILFAGGHRDFLMHIPTKYDDSSPAALVIGMHGGLGSADQFEEQSQLSLKSEEEGFIAVYPNGSGYPIAPNLRTWNAGTCCGYASTNNIDDVGFIIALIDSLSSIYNINLDRVYATGFSNGAQMSYRLACEIPDKIAAIAPVGGSQQFMDCSPSEPVPVIHFHSKLDSNVPYEGGIGDGPSQHYNPPLDSVMTFWSDQGGCLEYQTYTEGSNYTFEQWHNCECLYTVDYYITDDGGHSWPGGNVSSLGDQPSEFINANDIMWSFFQQHTNSCNATTQNDHIVNFPKLNFDISAYPNPTRKGVTNLKINGQSILKSVNLISADGSIKRELPIPNHEYSDKIFTYRLILQTEHLSSGTYAIIARFEDQTLSEFIMILD